MFPTEGIDAYHFFLVFLCVLLADGIAVQQFVIDIVRIVSLFALLLLFDGLFDHTHDNLLKVVQRHKVSSDDVAVTVVVILLEQQQFFSGGEGGLDEFDNVSEGEVDSNVEIAKP